jgi:hypothetical protein
MSKLFLVGLVILVAALIGISAFVIQL